MIFISFYFADDFLFFLFFCHLAGQEFLHPISLPPSKVPKISHFGDNSQKFADSGGSKYYLGVDSGLESVKPDVSKVAFGDRVARLVGGGPFSY
ncbi:MAG: hypothetical protein G01um101420_129 [Parcubacteria group bacterium Gr01-1014_20]|nr:MAG: hypothetical protein G01um101420_129 [Parcubacteria group bacterium Gr01-1014_20]